MKGSARQVADTPETRGMYDVGEEKDDEAATTASRTSDRRTNSKRLVN